MCVCVCERERESERERAREGTYLGEDEVHVHQCEVVVDEIAVAAQLGEVSAVHVRAQLAAHAEARECHVQRVQRQPGAALLLQVHRVPPPVGARALRRLRPTARRRTGVGRRRHVLLSVHLRRHGPRARLRAVWCSNHPRIRRPLPLSVSPFAGGLTAVARVASGAGAAGSVAVTSAYDQDSVAEAMDAQRLGWGGGVGANTIVCEAAAW
jgi:hypothetical protein